MIIGVMQGQMHHYLVISVQQLKSPLDFLPTCNVLSQSGNHGDKRKCSQYSVINFQLSQYQQQLCTERAQNFEP